MIGDDNGGGFDLNALMQQAQAMQEQLSRAQEELAEKKVDGSAGGDLVTVTMTGSGELLTVNIKPEACDPDDTESLGDLVVAAVRDASHKATALAQSAMPQMPQMPF
ncbi:YbaB/EbfC family nucleoid-associated protein [Nigerium massiliense]|uniref:YbaB/EbfC family nucleoid-associated protein n=1 Tax=Nigerium massiliense TaxID=1522317 RepID=UPI00058E9161|nr:YbaB/EbfC family nucleoid-associated protein [Nigerium massiliense]